MLTDPVSVTIDGVATSFPRVSSGINTATYQTADGGRTLSIQHTIGKRARRVVRWDFKKIAADPLVSAQNVLRSGSVYLVIDAPLQGFTQAELGNEVLYHQSFLTSNVITRVLGGES